MPGVLQSPYHRLGGDESVVRLVERFYQQMDTLPEAATIRALHADELLPMVDKLSVFLIGWMGGPQSYTERFGRVVIPAGPDPSSPLPLFERIDGEPNRSTRRQTSEKLNCGGAGASSPEECQRRQGGGRQWCSRRLGDCREHEVLGQREVRKRRVVDQR